MKRAIIEGDRYTCDICGRSKKFFGHPACSKKRQLLHANDKRRKAEPVNKRYATSEKFVKYLTGER